MGDLPHLQLPLPRVCAVFSMPSPDELIVDQTTRAKGADGREKEVSYRSVYTRKK